MTATPTLDGSSWQAHRLVRERNGSGAVPDGKALLILTAAAPPTAMP